MRPISITHQHLLSVIHAERERFANSTLVRILEVGCGSGDLMIYLAGELPRLDPGVNFEVWGFDVIDHGVQERGFLRSTVAALERAHPGIPWKERVAGIASDAQWPYPPDFFDVIVSNQVLEHVRDHDLVLREISRTLKVSGFSAHLFPLSHYVYEGHLNLPLAHRIAHFDLLRTYIRVCSRLGLGKYRSHHERLGTTLNEFVESHADYMLLWTNYLSQTELLRLTKRHGLRATFAYTKDFYLSKSRSMIGMKPYPYRRASAVLEYFAFALLKYVSSVTLFMEKKNTYKRLI